MFKNFTIRWSRPWKPGSLLRSIFMVMSLFISQALNYIKTCALHGGAADFNLPVLFFEMNLDRVCDEIETLPMMASRRVIVLKKCRIFRQKWPCLEPLIEKPVYSSVFILIGSKIDKRRRIFKLLLESHFCGV